MRGMLLGSLVVVIGSAAACGGGDGPGGSGQACDNTLQCPAGELCNNHVCTPTSTCTTATDCDPGQICSFDGRCIPIGTCVGNADCADADYCSASGVCIPDGSCAVDDDCLAGMVCTDHACVPGGGCGAQALDITPVPPNMLLVLDRSCSMTDMVGAVTKWQAAVTAIHQLTTNFAAKVRWGLTMFPDTVTPNCGQSTIPIRVGPGNETPIQTLLTSALMASDANFPDGPCVTNIDSAMQQAATETALDDTSRRDFVMLVTDGMQSGCSAAGGNAGTTQIITDLRTLRNVDTFVVGFGSGVDVTHMNQFAVAGGHPLPGANEYYQADNAVQLEMALGQIAGLIIGCDFVINNPPADLSELYVFFNNVTMVPHDPSHADGWDYDPATMHLTIYGNSCTQLQSGQVTDVDVVFGCPAPVPG